MLSFIRDLFRLARLAVAVRIEEHRISGMQVEELAACLGKEFATVQMTERGLAVALLFNQYTREIAGMPRLVPLDQYLEELKQKAEAAEQEEGSSPDDPASTGQYL